MVKLDLGCGKNKKAGFLGCDQYAFDGEVDHVFNIGRDRWPFEDGSVEEAHCSHFLEHLTQIERVHFMNELHRVLVAGGTCAIITPHWASNRAYGDPTHQWPGVSEMSWYYLSRVWRLGKDGQPGNAPHTDKTYWPEGYDCDFEATWGYGMHPSLVVRNQEYQQFAMAWYKEAILDMHTTLKALK